jgi:endo-1,4-beta-xylanase
MNRFFRLLQAGLIVALAAASLATSRAAHGQAETPTLRELAEKRKFLVGAVTNTWNFEKTPTLPEVIGKHFNLFAPENEGKLCFIQPEEGKVDYTGLDKLVEFAEKYKMQVHGHVLVWHECFPDWLKAKSLTRDQALDFLRTHITTTVTRYKGRIKFWDVVNEAFLDDGTRRVASLWQKWIGDDYIEQAFKFARAADPDAILYYNDYNAEAINPKSDAIYAMVKDFKARDIPINGVGLQSHVGLGEVGPGMKIDPAKVSENMARLDALGLEVQITEMDVSHQGKLTEDLAKLQAGTFYQYMQACLNAKNCTGFTVWGVSDADSWLRRPEFFDNPEVSPLLFDDKLQPKLAYTALADALARAAGEKPILTDEQVKALTERPKTRSVPLPDPVKASPAQLAPDSVNGRAYYAAFPVKITLDGKIEDWANIPRDTPKRDLKRGAGDTTAMTFAAAADDTNLYFLAEVTDSKVIYGQNNLASDWYQEDSPEFYINATGDLGLLAYKPGVVQLAIPAANIDAKDKAITAGGNSNTIKAQAVVVKTDTGYIAEVAVPLKSNVWSITPKQGEAVGFQVHLNGTSNKGRDLKLIWSVNDTQDKSWTDPSVFGRLIFWNVETK